MILTYHIRKNATGEVRQHVDDCPVNDGANSIGLNVFQWVENNYSCDCNRCLFFCRAAGEEEPHEVDCGDAAYDLIKVTGSDGSDHSAEFECANGGRPDYRKASA